MKWVVIMFDFAITNEGELKFDVRNKDISKSQHDAITRQIALCRIKSIVGDWYNTNIGANLEEFIGEVCNDITANKIISRIISSLTYDKFMKRDNIYCIPQVEANSISVLVFLKGEYNDNPSMINVTIDITGGVKIDYGTLK